MSFLHHQARPIALAFSVHVMRPSFELASDVEQTVDSEDNLSAGNADPTVSPEPSVTSTHSPEEESWSHPDLEP